MRSAEGARVFRYGMSRPGLIMLGLLVGLIGLLWAQFALFDLIEPDEDSLIGLAFIMLIVGGVLAPVPALEVIWWARGRVEVDTSGLRWRGWGTWNDRGWGEILGVGMPPPDAARGDDERIHLVTEDECEFIHGFGLRDREALRDALRSYGDLAEVEVIGRHTFLCRPGAGSLVRDRAEGHVDPDDDVTDFWAGRFRRF